MNKYDLIITVINRGFADEVMAAARKAGAFGGTVINGRGTGSDQLQKFFGSVVQPEKELVLILAEREKRTSIMGSIGKDAALAREGMGICFSMPVDEVYGMTAFPEADEVPEKKEI